MKKIQTLNQDGSAEVSDERMLPPELERYLELCKRMFERMEAENSWPWERDAALNEFLEQRIKENEKPLS